MSEKAKETSRFARLHTHADIERVKRCGKRVHTELFNLVFCASPTDRVRVGVIVGRRLGKAVKRNRVKRIFRELARHSSRDLAVVDMLVFPKRAVLTEDRRKVHACWDTTLKHAGLLPSTDFP